MIYPKVSVIMPCYNDGKYIYEAINSVKKQTYTNWELIIIDDGSDDSETKQIIDSISDERITVYHTNHLRPAGARNYGINHSSGKYILPLDSDDTIDDSYIEKAVSIMEKHSDVGVVYCYADLFGEKKGRWELPDYSIESMLVDNVVFVTALFLKSDWEAIGGFNTELLAGMEDYDFWLGILGLNKRIYQIKEVLFHYRIKPVSRTTGFQSNVKSMKETYRQIYKRHEKLYMDNAELYMNLLRDALIEQISARMKYEKYFAKVEKLKKNRFFRKVARIIIRA